MFVRYRIVEDRGLYFPECSVFFSSWKRFTKIIPGWAPEEVKHLSLEEAIAFVEKDKAGPPGPNVVWKG